MLSLGDIVGALPSLKQAEKAQLLQRLVRDLGDAFPGIDSNPAINGGEPTIVRTWIPVWVLVRHHQLGATDAELLRDYPSLRAEDIANAWAYYRSHRDEIEQHITDNEQA